MTLPWDALLNAVGVRSGTIKIVPRSLRTFLWTNHMFGVVVVVLFIYRVYLYRVFVQYYSFPILLVMLLQFHY